MKKLVLGFFSIVLLILLLVVGLVVGVLGTQPGTQWLLAQVQSMAPGVIRIGASEGHFFGRLQLTDVDMNMETAQIDVDRVVLDWSPRQLLTGELLVNELSLAGLHFAGQPAANPPPSEPLQWPITLPAISPPVRVVISRVEMTDVEFISQPEANPVVVDQALLQAHWDKDGIVLDNFSSSGPTYSLAVDGRIDPLDAYATLLENRITVSPVNGPALAITGRIEGDTERLQAAQQLSGEVKAELTLALDQPLVKPAWQAGVQLKELPGSLISADLPMTLAGEVSASGGLDSAVAAGQLISRSDAPALDGLQLRLDAAVNGEQQLLTLNRVELSHQQQALRLVVQGTASADALNFSGEWSSLQWPLTAVKPTVRSEQGRMTLRGPLDDYRLEIKADLVAQDIIEGTWSARGQGNRERLTLEKLNGGLLGGQLDVQGGVAWAPLTSWDLSAQARRLRLQPWLADPEAIVHLRATTSGTLKDTGPEARVTLQNLGGRVNGQPLTGQGELTYTAERIDIDRLRVKNADALLDVDGMIGRRSDLSWRLQVPDVGQLIADGGGSIKSQGRLSGARQTPRIVGEVAIDQMELPALRINSLVGDIDLDLLDRRRSQVDLNAQALTIGANVVERLQLAFDGYIRNHQVVMQAEHKQGKAELMAQGSYDQLWAGKLMRLDLDTPALGPWHLRAPSALTLAAESATADDICLQRESAHLCAQGKWRKGAQSSGKFDLVRLPLSWLKAVFPEQIKGATGVLSASGEVAQASTIQASMKAGLTPGELLLEGASEDVSLAHKGARFTLNTKGQGAQAALNTGIDQTRLEVKVSLPDVLAVADKQQAKLSANIMLDAPDLDFLPLLVPTISRLEGNMRAKFDVRGEVGKPWIGGGGQLKMSTLEMHHLGVAVSDTLVDVGVTNNTLTLDGRAISGGRVNLQGGMLLDGAKGWPLQLSIKGQDFVAVNMPNLMVTLNPDLKVQRSSDGVNILGSLTIPAAEILVRDLPSGSRSASPDIVIVREGGAHELHGEENAPVAIDITLALGDKVHLAALGLDAFLRGELALRARPGRPLRATGDLRLFDGVFRAYGQRLVIERGLFSFAKSPVDNPGVNVRAVRTIGDVEVGVNALGTVKEMIVTTFSSPSMSENDRISYLVTGKPAREGASLSLDRQVAKNLTVGVTVDTDTGDRAFLTRYRLSRTLYTEVSSSARSSALDLFYTVEVK